MAKCRECGTEIPDGAEYCENCKGKLNTANDSESYLDSLLNAVINEEPKRRENVFPKRETSSLVSVPEKEETEKAEEVSGWTEPDTDVLQRTEAGETENIVSEESELPDLSGYNIFDEDEMDETFVNRMLEEDLQEGWKQEEAEPVTKLEDFADLFSGEEKAVPQAEEEAEPVTKLEDFADLFSDGEESVPLKEEAQMVTGLEDFADLFLNGEEHTEEPVSDAEPVVDPSVTDFLTGFGEENGDLFEFGAEPLEMDFAENTKEEAVPQSRAAAGNKNTENKKEKKESNGLSALYHKLFDNVKVDPSKVKPQPTREELEAKKKAKQEEKKRTKEEKEAAQAEKKEQEKQVKLEKQRIKKEAKAEKKAKKLKEAQLMLEEMQGTRINPAGASVVFVFFALIALGVILGTGVFAYSNSIKNAEYEFNRDEYTLAYNEIYGLEIKDEDMLLYDRVMTVMYVQKQLNSYYNYYGLKDYPRALDSLLKGLQRYEKYIALAVELDVDSDLDSVRKKILTEIQTSFSLTEQEAMEIIQVESRVEYSEKVYDTIDRLELEK